MRQVQKAQWQSWLPQAWLRQCGGDMVWNALVIITVLLPLASLTIDVPRYFTLRARLQLAADAAAAAVARCVDVTHFQQSGETRLRSDCVATEPGFIFSQATQDLHSKGYAPSLGAVAVDEGEDTVSVAASGTTTLFFGLTPAFAVNVSTVSSFRMDQR